MTLQVTSLATRSWAGPSPLTSRAAATASRSIRFCSADLRSLDRAIACSISAALKHPREVVAIEIQLQLAELIDRNAALNSLTSVRGVCADIRARRIAGVDPASFDLIVANPPYYAAARGRHSPGAGRRVARSGTDSDLADFVAAARRYACNGARVAFTFAANRSAELIATMRARQLEPKRMRFVHPRVDLPAASVLVEARAAGGVEVAIEPPLILYDKKGEYSAEARAMLAAPSGA